MIINKKNSAEEIPKVYQEIKQERIGAYIPNGVIMLLKYIAT